MSDIEKPVKSPCISLCALSEEGICAGCHRTGNQISHWGSYSNEQRRQVLREANDRARRSNPFAV